MLLLHCMLLAVTDALPKISYPKRPVHGEAFVITCSFSRNWDSPLIWKRNGEKVVQCVRKAKTKEREYLCIPHKSYSATANATASTLQILQFNISNDLIWSCEDRQSTAAKQTLTSYKYSSGMFLKILKIANSFMLFAWIQCSNPIYTNITCYFLKRKSERIAFNNLKTVVIFNCSRSFLKSTLTTVNITAEKPNLKGKCRIYCEAVYPIDASGRTRRLSSSVDFEIKDEYCSEKCIVFVVIIVIAALGASVLLFMCYRGTYSLQIVIILGIFLMLFDIGVTGLTFVLGSLVAGIIVCVLFTCGYMTAIFVFFSKTKETADQPVSAAGASSCKEEKGRQ